MSDLEGMIFPEELATDVRRSEFHVIENSDIASKEDLDRLVRLMFEYPERNYYLFAPKDHGANSLVLGAEKHGILRIDRVELRYFPHPNFERDYIKIDKPEPVWN